MDITLQHFLIFIVLGAISGACSGLLSVGGGIIYVPAFSYLFAKYELVPADQIYHVTLATSIACIFFNFLISFLTHHKNKNTGHILSKPISTGVIIGSIIGSSLVWQVPELLLKIIFVFACISLILSMGLPDRLYCLTDTNRRPTEPTLICYGVMTGILCNLISMGGNFTMLPLMRRFNVPTYQSIGLCSLIGMILAGIGTLGYFVHSGIHLHDSLLGLIYLPALIGILLASNITTRMCAHFSKKISPRVLRISMLALGIIAMLHFCLHNLYHQT